MKPRLPFLRILLAAPVLLLCCKSEKGSFGAGAPGTAAKTAVIRVAAASDLTAAFEAIGRAFQTNTGQTVSFSFGASGLLAKQLREGAPFDVFAAANVSFVDDVVKAGTCDGSTQRLYAEGHLALWSPKNAAAQSLQDLVKPAFARIAIANPEHAPYGQAAHQALQASDLWSQLQPRLVFGENIRQALQLAQSGNADAALVSQSLVRGDEKGVTVRVDPALHAAIVQALVVCNKGGNKTGGVAFATFITSAEGQTLLESFGFGIPDAGSAAAVSPKPALPLAPPVKESLSP